MDEKNNILRFIAIAIIAFIVGGITGAVIINSKNTTNNRGIESNTARERELLTRIGDYERREESRVRAESARIAREGKRIEQTEKRLGAIRELDRRSSDLYEELAMEAGALQDFYLGFKREYYNDVNNTDSEKLNK